MFVIFLWKFLFIWRSKLVITLIRIFILYFYFLFVKSFLYTLFLIFSFFHHIIVKILIIFWTWFLLFETMSIRNYFVKNLNVFFCHPVSRMKERSFDLIKLFSRKRFVRFFSLNQLNLNSLPCLFNNSSNGIVIRIWLSKLNRKIT